MKSFEEDEWRMMFCEPVPFTVHKNEFGLLPPMVSPSTPGVSVRVLRLMFVPGCGGGPHEFVSSFLSAVSPLILFLIYYLPPQLPVTSPLAGLRSSCPYFLSPLPSPLLRSLLPLPLPSTPPPPVPLSFFWFPPSFPLPSLSSSP